MTDRQVVMKQRSMQIKLHQAMDTNDNQQSKGEFIEKSMMSGSGLHEAGYTNDTKLKTENSHVHTVHYKKGMAMGWLFYL